MNALIYEIIVAEINAIKYFNAVNATLFTSGVLPLTRNRHVPAVSKLGETELKMEKAEGLLSSIQSGWISLHITKAETSIMLWNMTRGQRAVILLQLYVPITLAASTTAHLTTYTQMEYTKIECTYISSALPRW